MSLTMDEIQNRVSYHAPTQQGFERHAKLTAAAADFMAVVSEVVPQGREQSLVFTKIEEAKFWASAGVARNPETV